MAIANSSTATTSTAAALPTSSRPPPPWSRRARAVLADSDSTAANLNATNASDLPIAISSMRRELFLGYTCFENARAHWFIFIPSITIPIIGKVIQVTGNPHTGFGFQIKLNYNSTPDLSLLGTTHFVPLGSVSADQVVDNYMPRVGYGPTLRDYPIDGIEMIAYNQGMPYRDPNVALPPMGDPIWAQSLPQFERCQEWTRKLVHRLVQLGHLQPTAISALDTATSFGL